MRNKSLLMIGASAIVLAGCGTMQDGAAPGSSKADQAKYEYKRDRIVEQVKAIPDWFKDPPRDDANIYAVGTSITPDLQFAIDAANLNAKYMLADRINSRLRSQFKQFRAKVGTGDLDAEVMTELEKAVKNITTNTDVSGYSQAKLDIIPHGSQYRVFVLLEYSDDEANKIIMNRLRKDRILLSKIRSTKAFQDLDKSVNDKHEADSIMSENNTKIELGIIGDKND